MPRTVPADHEAFLASLRERHAHHLGKDRAYEEMMYHAHDPPSAHTLHDLVRFTREDRGAGTDTTIPEDPHVFDTLSDLVATMRWPDPSPLEKAARVLDGWDTLQVSTFLHTMIPDYPIFGSAESDGLARLGIDVPYTADPTRGTEAYGRYIEAVKRLREEARFEDVPESHHYLTRIVQTALKDLGEDR